MTVAQREGDGSSASSRGRRAGGRAVRKRADGGMSDAESAWRCRRTPGYVARVLELPRLRGAASRTTSTPAPQLRPIERTSLRARQNGAGAAEILAVLDRAAADASRRGGAVVFAVPSEQLIAALQLWGGEGSAGVARLAPLSAVIRRQGGG